MASPSYDHALASFAAKNKACFDHADNRQTVGPPKNVRRNSFFRHVTKLADSDGGALDNILLSCVSRDDRQRKDD